MSLERDIEKFLKKGGSIQTCKAAKDPKWSKTWIRDYAKFEIEHRLGKVDPKLMGSMKRRAGK